MSVDRKLTLESRGIFFTNKVPTPSVSSKRSPYVCFTCMRNLFSETSAKKHMLSHYHLEHTNIFNKYFETIPPSNSTEKTSVMCKLCKLKLAWADALEHAQTHNVTVWLKPDDLHRTFFRHFISEHQNNIYKCNMCHFIYGHWFHAVEHIKDAKHMKFWNMTSAPSANYAHYENTMAQFEILVKNQIFIGQYKPYYCHACSAGFDNFAQANKHWEGVEHNNMRLKFTNDISQFKMKIPESLDWIKKSIFMVVMKDKIYCKICDIYMIDVKEIDTHVKGHKAEYVSAIEADNKQQSEMENFDPDNHSYGPSVPMTECALTVPDHLMWIISAHKVVVKHQFLYCVICKKVLNNNSAVEGHFLKHLKPSWQETYMRVPRKGLTRDAPATTKEAEKSGFVGTSGLGASSFQTAKRTAVSLGGFEANKIQKMNPSVAKPAFQSVSNNKQILPINSQVANNPPAKNPRPPLLSTPGPSGISQFHPDAMGTHYPAAMTTIPRNGRPGLLGNHPPLLPPFGNLSKTQINKDKNPRPNLIDLMKNIPSLLSKPVSKVPANNPDSSSISNGTTRFSNHPNPPVNNPPVNNQFHNNPRNNPINKPPNAQLPNRPTFGKNNPPKPNPQILPSNNALLNTQIMVKLHKASYLFFNKNMIYDMSPEKKRRIILSSQLSFFVKYTSDYFIYCVVCEKSIPYNLQYIYEHWCSSEHTEYLGKMEEDDKQFSNYPTQFSCLALSKEFMVENQKSGVASGSGLREFTCCACDVSVQDNDSLLGQHFQSETHQKNVQRFRRHSQEMCKDLFPLVESSWYSIEKYSCWPCQKIISNEVPYADHLESRSHLNIIHAMSPAEKKRHYFDSCTVCGILWFGDQDEFPKHCYKDAIHKELTRSIEDRVDHLPEEGINLCSTAEDTIAELIYEADKVLQDRGRESELIRSLELAVRRKFPEAKAHPFGSRMTGLGFTNSDIDIFLDCGGTYDGKFCHPADLIERIHHCLKLDSQAWSVESVIENSRTPIIKVYHSHSLLKCDVSFSNGLSVENTKLLKLYLDAYPPCREMILFIKKWLGICGISGSRNITSYAISWFVIFYLQIRQILPSVASLMTNNHNIKNISGWDVGMRQFSVPNWATELTTKQLLRGFFSYYAAFDYRFNVACPLLGLIKTKKEFLYLQLLPDEMKSYVEHVTTEPDPELFRIDSAMCIQDPYDLSHNLTKAVKKLIVNRFRKLCGKSAQILSSDQ
ncbi:uncharacterized protein LOC117167157 [Belonocnema kinseyi]|uniref:uncharacterized protein LOC117167157 n=1 Tax=Belonocnema kinseyi TaxID=2817044 RepID=UPI00143CCFC0|nr:uncharacterized protein LOC117167157 [Belonocnema kinseyi]